MNGASEYASLFTTGQYGKLYIVSGRHARGQTFHIYVLPEGVKAKHNGTNNPPLNEDAVEVYGVLGGQRGWTEYYGWTYEGKWKEDFMKLVEEKKKEADRFFDKAMEVSAKRLAEETTKKLSLLQQY